MTFLVTLAEPFHAEREAAHVLQAEAGGLYAVRCVLLQRSRWKGKIHMKSVTESHRCKKFRALVSVGLLPALLLVLLAGGPKVAAHGGEDHGDQKPKTETTARGAVVRTTRLGEFELSLKHPPLEPDTAATGRLFLTRYATNEPVDAGAVKLAVESATGAIIEIPYEKGSTPGSYTVQIPALPEGGYTLRATVTAGGATSTATFSDVEVSHKETVAAAGAGSWTQFLLMSAFLLFGVSLFAGLVYLAVKVVRHKPLTEGAVST